MEAQMSEPIPRVCTSAGLRQDRRSDIHSKFPDDVDEADLETTL